MITLYILIKIDKVYNFINNKVQFDIIHELLINKICLPAVTETHSKRRHLMHLAHLHSCTNQRAASLPLCESSTLRQFEVIVGEWKLTVRSELLRSYTRPPVINFCAKLLFSICYISWIWSQCWWTKSLANFGFFLYFELQSSVLRIIVKCVLFLLG